MMKRDLNEMLEQKFDPTDPNKGAVASERLLGIMRLMARVLREAGYGGKRRIDCPTCGHYAHRKHACKGGMGDLCDCAYDSPESKPKAAGNREPRPGETETPLFNAIWNVVKGWETRPTPNTYQGVMGNDVCAIIDAIAHEDPSYFHRLGRDTTGDVRMALIESAQALFAGWPDNSDEFTELMDSL